MEYPDAEGGLGVVTADLYAKFTRYQDEWRWAGPNLIWSDPADVQDGADDTEALPSLRIAHRDRASAVRSPDTGAPVTRLPPRFSCGSAHPDL